MNALLWTSQVGLSVVVFGCATTNPTPSTAASPKPDAPPSCAPAPAGSAELTTSSATAVVTPTVTPTTSAPADGPSSLVTGFDCHSTAESKREESLREWASGGPFGAAWNIYGWPIECEARLNAPCDATLHVQLFANARALKAETRVVEHGSVEWRVEIPDQHWSAALGNQDLVFQTLALTLAGVLVCEADGEHWPFADAFIAGVSGGE